MAVKEKTIKRKETTKENSPAIIVVVDGVKIKPPFKNAPNPKYLKITTNPKRKIISVIERNAKNELSSDKDLRP